MALGSQFFFVIAGQGIAAPDGRTVGLSDTFYNYLNNANNANGVWVADGSGNFEGNYIVAGDTYANQDTANYAPEDKMLNLITDIKQLRVGDGLTEYGLPFALNSNRTIYVTEERTAAQSGTALLDALTRAKAATPGGSALSASNPVNVLVEAGTYTLPVDYLTFDAEGVSMVGLRGSRHTTIDFGTNGSRLEWNANNCQLSGFKLLLGGTSLQWNISAATGSVWRDLYLRTSTGNNNVDLGSSTNVADLAGLFIDCRTNGRKCLASSSSSTTVSATFIRCKSVAGADYAWGGCSAFSQWAPATGTWIDCDIWGSFAILLSGTMYNCGVHNRSGNADSVRVTDGGKIENCHIYQSGTGDCVGASAACAAFINRCNLGGTQSQTQPGFDNNITNFGIANGSSWAALQNLHHASMPAFRAPNTWAA